MSWGNKQLVKEYMGKSLILSIALACHKVAKSGLRMNPHFTISSGRPERKYLLSDQRLEWTAEGPLF